ncbi:MAG: EamA family transporter [Rhizobiales bacterium]|nr:EamA family transporter [Hyphomicrobiales bacterium]
MPHANVTVGSANTARMLVVLLAFAWGLNWIAAAVALREVSPWALRVAGTGIGVITLLAAAIVTGHKLRVPRGEYLHVMVAGFFNVAAFQIFSGFAQLNGATSRAIIITYSMPIWTTMLSALVLGERLNRIRLIAFSLCVAGLAVLLWPLFANEFPTYVFYSLGCALSWTIATVYIKWAKVKVEPLANAAWQLLFGLLFIIAGTLVFEGTPHLWPVNNETLLGVLFIGILGVGLAHFLWWSIVGRLPTITASLGTLINPVVGVTASALYLGEKLTVPDIVGFVMIFAAASCVLLQPNVKHAEMPE